MDRLRGAMMLATCACIASPALAVTDGITAQGTHYVTGGITQDERDALGARSEPQSLRVVTVTRGRGEYLADVRVVIADGNGRRVLDTRLDGPWLQVELDPGRYTVGAELERQSMTRPVTIAQGRRDLYMYFDVDAESLPEAAD